MVEYKSYDELKGKTLVNGDKVIFVTSSKTFNYVVISSYLKNTSGISNDEIFEVLNIDKYEFCSKAYGYNAAIGAWPQFKDDDYKALTRGVLELFKIIGKVKVEPIVRHYVEDTSCNNHIRTYNSYKDAVAVSVPVGKKYVVYELVPVAEIESVVKNIVKCLKKVKPSSRKR